MRCRDLFLGEHHIKNESPHKHAFVGFATHSNSFKRLALRTYALAPHPSPRSTTPNLLTRAARGTAHPHPRSLAIEALAFVPFGLLYIFF